MAIIRIWLVDGEDAPARDSVLEWISERGHPTRPFPSVPRLAEALNAQGSPRPDIVVAALDAPGGGAAALAQGMRDAFPEFQVPPLVLYSSTPVRLGDHAELLLQPFVHLVRRSVSRVTLGTALDARLRTLGLEVPRGQGRSPPGSAPGSRLRGRGPSTSPSGRSGARDQASEVPGKGRTREG